MKAGGDGALLLSSPDPQGRAFGRVPSGASLGLLGTVPGFDKVELGKGRFAFVPSTSVAAGSGAAGAVGFDDLYSHAPPLLDVKAASMATRGDKVKISVNASDSQRLVDSFIFVGTRKLFYRSNRDASDPKKMTYDFEAPLRPGVNVVTVVARENTDTTTRRTLVIRKDAPDGSLLKTPKNDDPAFDGAVDDGDD